MFIQTCHLVSGFCFLYIFLLDVYVLSISSNNHGIKELSSFQSKYSLGFNFKMKIEYTKFSYMYINIIFIVVKYDP